MAVDCAIVVAAAGDACRMTSTSRALRCKACLDVFLAALARQRWSPVCCPPRSVLACDGRPFVEWAVAFSSSYWSPRLIALAALAMTPEQRSRSEWRGSDGRTVVEFAAAAGHVVAQAVLLLCMPEHRWPASDAVCAAVRHGGGLQQEVVDACRFKRSVDRLPESPTLWAMPSSARLLSAVRAELAAQALDAGHVRRNARWVLMWAQRACCGGVLANGEPLPPAPAWGGFADVARTVLRSMLAMPCKRDRLRRFAAVACG